MENKTEVKALSSTQQTARASLKLVKCSHYKLNLVAGLIRGASVFDALLQLEFCRKRIAKNVRELLLSAISNAENNHGMDIENLYVKEVCVGKAMILKRTMPRARGRAARVQKYFSNIAIILAENS